MTTPTTNHAFPKPIRNADAGTWGDSLNTCLDMIDGLIPLSSAFSASNLNLASNTGVSATLTFINGTVPVGQQKRWVLGEDSTPEGGGNAGSNFSISAYNDTGALISTPMAITRSTGAVTFSTPASFVSSATFNTITATGAATFGSTLAVTGAATFGSTLGVTGATTLTSMTATGLSTFTGGTVVIKSAGSNAAIQFQNSAGTVVGNAFYAQSTASMSFSLVGLANVTLNSNGDIAANPAGVGNFIVTTNNAFKPGGGSWAVLSDERIKNVTGEYEAGLDEVLQLRPVTYRYKTGEDREFVGLVAQEVEQIMPGMVGQQKGLIDGKEVSDLRSIDNSELIYALVNCVRQLKAEIEALKR